MICSTGMAGGSLVIGASAAVLRGAGFGAVAPGALGAGRVEGGGVIGPVDWAASSDARKRAANGIKLSKRLEMRQKLDKCRSPEIVGVQKYHAGCMVWKKRSASPTGT